MAKKIQVAILGCGQNAKKHLDAIEHCAESIELKAVCDLNAERLVQFSSRGVVTFSSLDELLLSRDIDLVVVCTPSGLHAEQVIKIANAKKHVICEKPLAIEYADAKKMVQACRENGVQLFTVKQMRYLPIMQAIKRAIEQGRFGKIYLATSNIFWTRPQHYYDEASWRGTKKFDGGALMNQASHYVDLLCWFMGDLQSVQARSATLARNIEMEDTSVLNLEFQSGAFGSFAVTMLTYPKNIETSITILGERGTINIGGVALDEVVHWQFADEQPSDADIQNICKIDGSVAAYCMRLYYQAVIDSMQNDKKTKVIDGAEGLKSLECISAAYKSAQTGSLVLLPLT
ncbi:MAG: oxidoreductase [Legionellaceae bacterium]|nr:oxidoreductase [Legionellaceae bacterium]